jgi:hypothetical protein
MLHDAGVQEHCSLDGFQDQMALVDEEHGGY